MFLVVAMIIFFAPTLVCLCLFFWTSELAGIVLLLSSTLQQQHA